MLTTVIPAKPEVSHYLALLLQHDLCQVVDKPTHKRGHILDHVICHPDDNLLIDCKVSPNRYSSDHHMIECKINKIKPCPKSKDLDLEVCKADLSREFFCDLVLLSVPDKQSEQ